MVSKFPFYKQLDSMDCGPTCLRMIAKFHGKHYSLQFLRENSYITKEGVSLLSISETAEKIGFRALSIKSDIEQLRTKVPLPCIAHFGQNHFVVIQKIKKDKVFVADPAFGLITYTLKEFSALWLNTNNNTSDKGILLLLEPTPEFDKGDDHIKSSVGLSFLIHYLKPHKKLLIQLFIGLSIGSLIGLIFPFLTQAIVDIGISQQNTSFITTILIAQLMLFFGRTAIEFIQNWILLHITTRLNISVLSDFLMKLMKLPMTFFESKKIGDLMQRIEDHERLKEFLTSTTLTTLFSFLNILVYGAVIAIYDGVVFLVFFIGTLIYLIWVLLFLSKRRELDFKLFGQMTENQSQLYEIITGMEEIKLNSCERQKRWNWEYIQAKVFKINTRTLALSQSQEIGAGFINELKNIIITFLVANSVIQGDMTLGMMMAVQYIIGQLNAPISQIARLVQEGQRAKIGLERLNEIHQQNDEDKLDIQTDLILTENSDINLSKIDYQYEGPSSPYVIRDLSVVIPKNKITAIVGSSGSGKTTLLKLILQFYPLTSGLITAGNTNLSSVQPSLWRQKCGVVMQDGYIFNDSIINNITMTESNIDKSRLDEAISIANLTSTIDSLPLGYRTKLGQDGQGLSQGQKQRVLIARAIYKDPEYLFFDEATSSLDANNEVEIMKKLNHFYKGKTVLVIAHRLSTVKNADQILVLEHGKIIEKGNHIELTTARGTYYQLVKNQLELGQ